MKLALIFFVVAALSVLAWACAESAPGGQRVSLDLTASVDGSGLLIKGSTDLPDVTLIAYEVTHEGFISQDLDERPQMYAEGQAIVSGGAYRADVDIDGWAPGTVTVWAGFQTILGTTAKQPASVVERFGEMGENLAGENVTVTGGMRRVEVERTVAIR